MISEESTVFRLRLLSAVVLALGLVTVSVAQEKQSFLTKFEPGKSFYQKLTTRAEQTTKVQGTNADSPQKHEQTFFFKWTPVSLDKGKAVVKMSIEGAIFKLDIAGQTISYDSTDPNPSGAAGNPGLADFFKNLIGLEFTITYGDKMVIEKVEGREQAITKLSTANPAAEPIIKAILSEEALKEMIDPSLGMTPPTEKAVNETWEKKAPLNLGPIGQYDRTYTYTYKGKDTGPTTKDLDRVEVKPSLTFKPPAAGTDNLLFRVKAGTITTKEVKQGYILYNPKTGRVEQARINVISEGELDAVLGAAESKVKLYMDQKMELDTSDTTFLTPKKP